MKDLDQLHLLKDIQSDHRASDKVASCLMFIIVLNTIISSLTWAVLVVFIMRPDLTPELPTPLDGLLQAQHEAPQKSVPRGP